MREGILIVSIALMILGGGTANVAIARNVVHRGSMRVAGIGCSLFGIWFATQKAIGDDGRILYLYAAISIMMGVFLIFFSPSLKMKDKMKI